MVLQEQKMKDVEGEYKQRLQEMEAKVCFNYRNGCWIKGEFMADARRKAVLSTNQVTLGILLLLTDHVLNICIKKVKLKFTAIEYSCNVGIFRHM